MRKARLIIPTLLFLILLSLVVMAALYSSKPQSVGPMIMKQIACLPESPDKITIVLEPTSEAVAEKIYNVEVKKGDVVRATVSVSWTRIELQAKQAKGFRFSTTPAEFQFYTMDRNQLGYIWKNLSKEFTVVIYAGASSQIIQYVPVTPSSFNWWFVWIPLVGIVLFVVYLRIRRAGRATQCPKCNEWWARVYEGSKVIGRKRGYDETVSETDVHRDNEGQITGTTRRSRQEHIIYHITKYSYHCKFCGHKWTSTGIVETYAYNNY